MQEDLQQEQNQPPEINVSKKGSWFSRHRIVGITIIAALFIAAASVAYVLKVGSTVLCCENPVVHKAKTAETSDWKTYKNEELGFEFKYPISFGNVTEQTTLARDMSGSAKDCIPEGYNLSIRFSNTNNFSLSGDSKYFNDCFEGRGGFLSDYNIVEVSKDSMEFRQDNNLVKPQKVNIVKRVDLSSPNQYGYEFQNYFCEGCEGEISAVVLLPNDNVRVLFLEADEATIIDQILSAFKVIDNKIDIADWKTYRNEEYGFEFMHPRIFNPSEEENVGLLKEIYLDNGLGLYIFIANDQSIKQGLKDCGGNPECFSYEKPCSIDKCSTYNYEFLSKYYSKKKVFLKNQLVVDFSQMFNLINGYTGELDDNKLSDFIVSQGIGKDDQEALKIFDVILSTFKFIK